MVTHRKVGYLAGFLLAGPNRRLLTARRDTLVAPYSTLAPQVAHTAASELGLTNLAIRSVITYILIKEPIRGRIAG